MAPVKSRQVSCNRRYRTSAADLMIQCHLHAAFVGDSQPSSSVNSHFLSGNGGGESVGWFRGRDMGG